jgi:hypothetical protein
MLIEKIPEYEQLLNASSDEIDRLNHIMREKIGENDNLKREYNVLEVKYKENKEQRLPQLENKVNNLIAENDRINGILQDRLRDLEDWKNRCLSMESRIDKYIHIEQDKIKLEETIHTQVREIEERGNIIGQLEG